MGLWASCFVLVLTSFSACRFLMKMSFLSSVSLFWNWYLVYQILAVVCEFVSIISFSGFDVVFLCAVFFWKRHFLCVISLKSISSCFFKMKCREWDFVKIAVHQYEENFVTSFKSNLLLMIFWLHIINYSVDAYYWNNISSNIRRRNLIRRQAQNIFFCK